MQQLDLMDWTDSKRVIKQLPPAQATQHRAFIIEQLKPIMRELEALKLSPLSLSEALAYFSNRYQEQALQSILNPSDSL